MALRQLLFAAKKGEQISEILRFHGSVQPRRHERIWQCFNPNDVTPEHGLFLPQRQSNRDARLGLACQQASQSSPVLGFDGVGRKCWSYFGVWDEKVKEDILLGLIANVEEIGADREALAFEAMA